MLRYICMVDIMIVGGFRMVILRILIYERRFTNKLIFR